MCISKGTYCRTHVRVCLYIAYIARGSASLCIKNAVLSFCTLALSAAATVANIKMYAMMRKLPISLYLGQATYVCSTVCVSLLKDYCKEGVHYFKLFFETFHAHSVFFFVIKILHFSFHGSYMWFVSFFHCIINYLFG